MREAGEYLRGQDQQAFEVLFRCKGGKMQSDYMIEMKNITKRYPGVVALDNVRLQVRKGEVHALLGENGAGKSTLIKTLAGAIHPDEGEIIIQGKSYRHMEPRLAMELGIGVIYQEFNLISYLTVANNIFLGNEPVKGTSIDEKKCNEECLKVFERLGLNLDPKAQVKTLSVAYQQLVEIAKAVSKNAKVLIMDEPTAALSGKEVDMLLDLVRKLREEGISIIYISHRLEELFEVADRVTIMRDGQYIETLDIKDCTRPRLISLMVGREMGENYPQGKYGTEEVVLEAKHLTNDKIDDISFQLHKGEILGFGGLVGAGRTETARAIFGADKCLGEIFLDGKRVSIQNPGDALKNGIAFITEDRKQQGLLMKLSIRENISISYLGKMLKHKISLDLKKEKELAEKYQKQLNIKTPSIEQLVSNLSGGNQQKVVLAKWLLTNSRVIIFDEPTRGIDVGVKFEIYQIMRDLAKQGISIIMISSDMPELLGVSDRILVMKEGKIVGELAGDEIQQENVMQYAVVD